MNNPPRPYLPVIIYTLIICFTISCKNQSSKISVTTTNVSGITQTGAVSGGSILAGKRTVITGRGVCWSDSVDPSLYESHTSDGTGSGIFQSYLTGLRPGSAYYLRAYAITGNDTVYGRNIAFSTKDYETLSDIDSNVYKNILIGRQTWMAENLRTTRLNDGTPIPLVTNETVWSGLTRPGMCYYRNEEEAYKPLYGALYNWYTVNTGKLCPPGWHVPSDVEWSELTNFLGGEARASGALKEPGTTFWVEPNKGATNESGFTAYPGGFRFRDGKFYDFGFSGYWWASGEYSETRAFFRFLYFEDTNVYRFDNDKKNGFSVRCLKD